MKNLLASRINGVCQKIKKSKSWSRKKKKKEEEKRASWTLLLICGVSQKMSGISCSCSIYCHYFFHNFKSVIL
jgi:hypothetical protein